MFLFHETKLITDPNLLFFDEPTSGLDSFMALTMVECMKTLCQKENKTIICTIHQPSSEVFEKFDTLCLLAEGKLAYLGAVSEASKHFASLGYPVPDQFNPSDHYSNFKSYFCWIYTEQKVMTFLFGQIVQTLAVMPSNRDECLVVVEVSWLDFFCYFIITCLTIFDSILQKVCNAFENGPLTAQLNKDLKEANDMVNVEKLKVKLFSKFRYNCKFFDFSFLTLFL
jgi:hypothetical protein